MHHRSSFLAIASSLVFALSCAANDGDTAGPVSSGTGGKSGAGGANQGGAAGKAGGTQQGGAAGEAGSSGAAGDAGSSGAAGDAGSSGAAGDAGSSGAAGDAGASGAAGDAGVGGAADAGPDVAPDAPFPCNSDECYIASSCVAAGTPHPSDPCQACLPTKNLTAWTKDDANTTCDGKPFWTGVTHAIGKTPYGHSTAISCHNCYTSEFSSTLTKIHDAQTNGADLIELDLKEQGGTVYVQHDDNGYVGGPKLSDVLADPPLKAGDQMLFMEFKETAASDANVGQVLDALVANGYGTAGRPVVLRAFDAVSQNLLIARRLLATAKYASLRPNVRLMVLFSKADGNDIAALQTKVRQAREKGYHGVEFEYQTPNLFGALVYARSLDLGINVWTVPSLMGEVFIANLRDEVDAITVDYSLAKSRAVVTANNGLFYMNVWNQGGTSGKVKWYRGNTTAYDALVGGAGQPTLETLPVGQDRFGTSLVFAAAQKQSIPLYDADNDPTTGYFVAAVVNFDQTIPADGDTSVLLGKADSGSFSLELFNPAGNGDTDAVLRFGVHVTDSYRYATYPAGQLNGTQSYFVTAAFDGEGGTWLWVNNDSSASTSAAAVTGGATQNDSTMLLGADPQGTATPRFFFSGRIQMALVQKWANH